MDPKIANSNSARTSAVEQQRVQLVEERSKVQMVGIQEATITFKLFAAVAAGPSPEAPSGDGPSTPAAANSVTNDLLQLLVDEMSLMRRTLESLSQELQNSNKLLALLCYRGTGRYSGYPCNVPGPHIMEDAEKLLDGILTTIR